MAMTLDEKEQLFILLHKYMEELIAKNDTMSLEVGLKAQFNHARCIARKLEAGIEGGGSRFDL